MAVTSTPYSKFIEGQISGAHFVDLDGDTIKLALLTSAHSPDTQAHEFFSDVDADEVSGTNYPAGGIALDNKVVGLTLADGFTIFNDFSYFDADDSTFANVTVTFRYGVVFRWTGSAATSPLITLIDFGTDQAPIAFDYLVQWPDPSVGAIVKFQNGA